MKLPELENPKKYVGLYVFDFGDHCGIGFTGEEIAELFESERYKNCKAYKVHKAYPDGEVELKGVRAEIFQAESGMFFYADALETAEKDFKSLVDSAIKIAPPCRAKVHLAKYSDSKFVTALIYPAEYEDEISIWLSEVNYRTGGAAEGGITAVQRYYTQNTEVLDRHQLFGQSTIESRTGEDLLAGIKLAVQR